MKLELKYLAPYLTYGLKVIVGTTKRDIIAVSLDSPYCFVTAHKGSREKQIVGIENVKPILRPLSDLSKLGVDDITINEHTINLMIEEKFNEDYGLFEHYKGSLELVKEGDSSQGYDSKKVISFEVFEEIRNELLKEHYDLFGLIEKGLAIDINSLSLADA